MRRGKRIVLTTFGSFGDIHPYMAIALELQARGHNPKIATSGLYQEKTEGAGLSFAAMRPDLPPPREQDQEMMDRIMEPKSGPKYLMEELIFPYVREGYEDLMQAFEPIDEFREELRIPDYGNPVFEGQHSPTLVLALFSEHFAATQPDWPAQTRITGFAFYDGQVAEQASVCVESQRGWVTSAQ